MLSKGLGGAVVGCYPSAMSKPANRFCRPKLLDLRWAVAGRYGKGITPSVKLNGEMVYLWCAVDDEGEVLESYVTKTQDKTAALRFMKKALKRHGSLEAITTDGVRWPRWTNSANGEKQEIGRWANSRVENSHLPFRRRERAMLSSGK